MSQENPAVHDDSLVGTTSQQDLVQEALSEQEEKKKSDWEIFNLWNGMLMLALLFITLATFRLVLILRFYSPDWPFGSSPWSTGF